ncbi:hypothetical protein SAMN05216564_10168 [Halopenitus persicus]|uniref:Uncharacterized protein n=1 Tax=Halopenitus persicus TaxID=1048396 RepID=A0A1H3DMA0_9EURY|nr:hypothetical protein SAMN05216564_10168 [Halopenitus persicus]
MTAGMAGPLEKGPTNDERTMLSTTNDHAR